MKDLSPSFSSAPDQSPHKYFKNLLKAFKKDIIYCANIDELQLKMETFLNAAKSMKTKDPHKKSIYHKPEVEKAMQKVFSEFDKYYLQYIKDPSKVVRQDIIDAIEIVESLLGEGEIY